jgi:hypothetical protein
VLIKIIDIALDATFLTIYNLSRFRKYLTVRKATQQEEEAARLVVEWLDACKKRNALQAELSAPTISRLYDTQATLLRTTRDAGDKCHYLLVKMRDHHLG